MQSKTTEVSNKIIHLVDTVATRSYPFTQETLDQLHDIRQAREEEHLLETGESVVIPAPVILAEAVDRMHDDFFATPHAEQE
jgi:hypothetical protein